MTQVIHGLTREQLVAQVFSKTQPDFITHECETCQGTGTVNEQLGGYSFNNPKAKCPDCEGDGEWYEQRDSRSDNGGKSKKGGDQ